ncbi:MAG: aminoacyl-tRNA hydrolase [Acidimicrobiia bacterium]|nr:aminoacyl-tRNA hydrolase [Acidimicrobiia bacterium]MDH3396523.1 aminoacyl-tRNA hydrolase [Acidimicrobiia bacterium]MDH5616123.1 aminoacyl-tRNA hydrolase [Acidimicrobiia bacterium]
MQVIVGLRNPGREYVGTRHNVGGEVAEELAARWNVRLKRGPLRVRADLARHQVHDHAVVLSVPRTFMNTCGPAVVSVLRYYKAGPEDLLVVHDDIDLPFARLRLQHARGTGGHNGVKSIVQSLGNNEFHRLKIGVGRPPGRMDPAAFVLRPFAKSEREEVDFVVRDAAEVIERWIEDPDEAVQIAARRRSPES